MTDWQLANPWGILAKGSLDKVHFGFDPPQFNAGHLNDSLTIPTDVAGENITIVASETSGLWQIDPVGGADAIPLSKTWNPPDLQCLTRSYRSDWDIFAGGAALWEHDFTRVPRLFTWNPIQIVDAEGNDLKPGMIWQMAVVPDTRLVEVQQPRLVIACDGGLLWAVIPKMPAQPYVFKKAIDASETLVQKFSGVAAGRRVPIGSPLPQQAPVVAAAWGDGTRGGIFSGHFDPSGTDLILKLIKLSKGPGGTPVVDFNKMQRTSVTSQGDKGDYMYAVAGAAATGSDPSGAIYCVLMTAFGAFGQWDLVNPDVETVGDKALFGGDHKLTGVQENYNNCIAVSPTQPLKVVIGWSLGYFLSKDSGNTWKRVDRYSDNMHADFHSIRFEESDPTQNTLRICCDGGYMTTNDFGDHHSSVANQKLPNLELNRGAPDNHNFGLLAASLQDNGNVRCDMYPASNPKPWQRLRGGDGFAVTFLRNGQLLDYNNDQEVEKVNDGIQERRLDIFDRPPTGKQTVGLIPFDNVAGTGLVLADKPPPLEPVDNPSWRSSTNEALVAVAGLQQQIAGLFLGQNDHCHWTILATIPSNPLFPNEAISAVSSADGNTVFIGTSSGRMFTATPPPASHPENLWIVTAVNVAPSPKPGLTNLPIIAIRARSDTKIYSIASGPQTLLFDAPTQTWTQVSNGDDNNNATTLETVPGKSDVVFVASNFGVFQSNDSGTNWTNISSGLPSVPRSTDLRFLQDPSGDQFLYLSTYGWSMFRKSLHFALFRNRTVTLSGTAGINGSSGRRDDVIPLQTRDVGPLHSVEEITLDWGVVHVTVYLTVRITYRNDDTVEIRWDVFMNDIFTGKNNRALPGMVILDPGASFYTNIRTDNTNDQSDVNILVTN